MRTRAQPRSCLVRLAFIESSVFTRRISAFGLDESLRRLQVELLENPLAGDTDPGTGGLRKIRRADVAQRRGKRGAYRVHYLYLAQHAIIAFVFVYGKTDRDSLSVSQKRALQATAATIIDEWRSA